MVYTPFHKYLLRLPSGLLKIFAEKFWSFDEKKQQKNPASLLYMVVNDMCAWRNIFLI